MNVEFVNATPAEIDAVAAELQAREDASGLTLPQEFVDGTKETRFRTFADLGFDTQPTLMQYLAFVVILLDTAGYKAARDVIADRMGWFLALYDQSVEPVLIAEYLFVNVND